MLYVCIHEFRVIFDIFEKKLNAMSLKRTLHLFTLLFLLLKINYIQSQNRESLMDSSYQYLSDKYHEFKEVDSLKAIQYLKIQRKRAIKDNNLIEIINNRSTFNSIKDYNEKYISFLDSIIKKTKLKPDTIFPAYAYIKKADFYLLNGESNNALLNYLITLKLFKEYPNINFEILSRQRIGLLKSKSGNIEEAKKIYLNLYKDYEKIKSTKDEWEYISLLINLSSTYSTLNRYDSAIYFNKKAYNYSVKTKDPVIISYPTQRQGVIEYKIGNYKNAIDSLKKTVDIIINDKGYSSGLNSYLLIAKSYLKLGESQNALKYFLKVDSLATLKNINNNFHREACAFLKLHYKNNEVIEKQLFYLEKVLKIDSTLNIRNKKLSDTFLNKYDKPKLIAERQKIIDQLEGNISSSNTTAYSLVGLSGIVLFLFLYQYNRRIELKKLFEKFNHKKENVVIVAADLKKEKGKLEIPEEVIEKVLIGIHEFEKNNQFINKELNLNSLANDLETNANYLSKIINYYKGVNFSNYINELRIDYVLQLLDNNTTIRKYSIKGIAEEVGFKNAESFSNAFYKKTGLKPSYYIRKLEKL